MEKVVDYFKGKRVFLTGHTGFKGAWFCRVLLKAGAVVTGYALAPNTEPSLWELLRMGREVDSVIGDVRDFDRLKAAFDKARPEIVFHLAAQPLVLEGYNDPVGTYGTNVMGTAHLLDCVRRGGGVQSVLNVTTDKVYQNNEWPWGYREADALNGYDPYSNSKSCSELVTETYARSFLRARGVAVSTARAGNVIGGGDFAGNRIIPDCARAAGANLPVVLRNPYSIRPYQHVLEALSAYMRIAQAQGEDMGLAGAYNVGPTEADCVTTGDLADLFCAAWGEGARREVKENGGAPHEAGFLRLDASKIKAALGWAPKWGIREAVGQTVSWEKRRLAGGDVAKETDRQIEEYFGV